MTKTNSKYRECHNCPYNGKCSEECLNCTCDEQYSYRYGRHLFDENIPSTPTQSQEKATSLPEDIEDKFRQAIIELFSMTPNELLLVQSIMSNQTLTEYAEKMQNLSESNKDFSRFKAYQTRKAILTKHPHLKLALLTVGQKRQLKPRKQKGA